MATGSINPFNTSDSEEEPERRRRDGGDSEQRSPSDEAQGRSPGPFSPPPTDTDPSSLLVSSHRTGAGLGAGSGAEPPRVSVDAIAAQLLRDQYILTALELHTEMLEAGRELPRLRDYFSNPGNFERQSATPPACKEQGVGLSAAGALIFPSMVPAMQAQDKKKRKNGAGHVIGT
ncbi:RAB11-binding protein RELCH homolog isoform X1 [Tachysurus ichikawai]